MSKKVDLLQLFIKEHVKIISYDPGYGKQLAFLCMDYLLFITLIKFCTG